MIPSCMLLNPATKADLLAACVQAEAALQAGSAQAAATEYAGTVTMWAAIAAAGIAMLVGTSAFVGVQNQIAAAARAGRLEREHALRREIYSDAVKAIAEGLGVFIRMADIRIAHLDVMDTYLSSYSDIHAIHLVAGEETVKSVLFCARSLGAAHGQLITRRPWELKPADPKSMISWGRTCTAKLREIVPAMVDAVAAMRSELGLPIDRDAYTQFVFGEVWKAEVANETLYETLMAGVASSSHTPSDT